MSVPAWLYDKTAEVSADQLGMAPPPAPGAPAPGPGGMPPGPSMDPAAGGMPPGPPMDPAAGGMPPAGPPPSLEDIAASGDPLARELLMIGKKLDLVLQAVAMIAKQANIQVPFDDLLKISAENAKSAAVPASRDFVSRAIESFDDEEEENAPPQPVAEVQTSPVPSPTSPVVSEPSYLDDVVAMDMNTGEPVPLTRSSPPSMAIPRAAFSAGAAATPGEGSAMRISTGMTPKVAGLAGLIVQQLRK